MNITLKSIKYMASLSDETHCFSANLFLDGKKMFGVRNSGHGAEDEIYAIKGGVEDVMDTYHRINTEIAKETYKQSARSKELGIPEMPNCLDFVVCDLMNDWLCDKEIKKSLRKITYMVGDKMYEVKLPPTKKNIEWVQTFEWWEDTNIILNTMPIEEVRQYFKA